MFADLERWRTEVDAHLALEGFDHEWARLLCWTRPGLVCHMRRRWASNTHIDEARREFNRYFSRTAA